MPPVGGGANEAAAEVIDADTSFVEVVEVDVEAAGGCFEGDVNGFVAEVIVGDDDAGDGSGGVDVDAGCAGGVGVGGIGGIAVDVVADDHVVVEIDAGSRGGRGTVVVHGDAGKAVVIEAIAGDYIGGVGVAGTGREDADASACSGKQKAVVVREIVGDDVVADAEGKAANGVGMRGHGDAAGVAVVVDVVVLDEIGEAGAGFITDEHTAGVVFNEIAGDCGVIGGHEMDAFAAVHLLAGFKGGDAGA